MNKKVSYTLSLFLFAVCMILCNPIHSQASSTRLGNNSAWDFTRAIYSFNHANLNEGDNHIEKIIFLSSKDKEPSNELPQCSIWGSDAYAYYDRGNETVMIYSPSDTMYLCKDSSEMFYRMYTLKEIQFGDKVDGSNVTDMSKMFCGCKSLERIDLSVLGHASISRMENAFNGCNSLKEINFGDITTTNVKSMGWLFSGCYSLQKIDLKCFDTSNVTNMRAMFNSCKSLKDLDLKNFDTSKVTSMERMFSNCESITSLVLNFDTTHVTDMNYMFNECTSLRYLDIRSLKISSTCQIAQFFQLTENLEVIFSPCELGLNISLWKTEIAYDDDANGIPDNSVVYKSLPKAMASHRYIRTNKSNAPTNSDPFPEELFVYQGKGTSYCVVSSATMMIKNRLYRAGDASYKNVTKESVKSVALNQYGDMLNNYRYVIDGKQFNLNSKQNVDKEYLLETLKNHPEGIVLYTWRKDNPRGKQHAVILTKYVNGEFYCVDPAISKFAETPLKDSSLKTFYSNIEDMYTEGIVKIWFIESSSVAPVQYIDKPAYVNEPISHDLGYTFVVNNVKYTVSGDGEITFEKMATRKATCTIPAEITLEDITYKVTAITENAFKNDKKLKKVTIGSNISKIGKNAFSGCKNLKNISIQTSSLTKKSVGKNAFKGINAKAKVKVPKRKLKDYIKVLKAKGIKGNSQKITK